MGGIINRPKWGWESRVKMKKNSRELTKKRQRINNVIGNVSHKQRATNKDKLVFLCKCAKYCL